MTARRQITNLYGIDSSLGTWAGVCFVAVLGITVSVMIICSDKTESIQDTNKNEKSRSHKHKIGKPGSHIADLSTRVINEEDSLLLPDLIDSPSEVNLETLKQLGVSPAHLDAVSDVLLDTYNEARKLRGAETNEIRFAMDTAVKIPSVPSERIDLLVNSACSRLSLLITYDAPISSISPETLADIKTLMNHQLNREFNCELAVTLVKSRTTMTSSARHTPSAYRDLQFNVVKKAANGSIERFTLDPVQSQRSEYFFLNVQNSKR